MVGMPRGTARSLRSNFDHQKPMEDKQEPWGKRFRLRVNRDLDGSSCEIVDINRGKNVTVEPKDP